MAACGGENLEAYKEKALEKMAESAKTTKELLIEDYKLILDSMAVYPLTVGDSIELINRFVAQREKYEKYIETTKKNLHSFFNFNYEDDKKDIKRWEETLKEIDKSEKDLERYQNMSPDETLCKVFICKVSVFTALTGRKSSFDAYIFDKNGENVIHSGNKLLIDYFKEKEVKK